MPDQRILFGRNFFCSLSSPPPPPLFARRDDAPFTLNGSNVVVRCPLQKIMSLLYDGLVAGGPTVIIAQPEDQYDDIDNVSDPVVAAFAAVEPDEDDTYDVMPETIRGEGYENWKSSEVVRTTHSAAAPPSVRCHVGPRRRRRAAPFSDVAISEQPPASPRVR